jgi:prephenate dehydrogenase
MRRRNVFMIGLGLIGGSIALSIKKEHHVMITGYDINGEQLELAKSLRVIDSSVSEIKDGAKEADLIVIAAPVLKTEEIIDELLKCDLKEHTIVTDVGSTKAEIVDKADEFQQKGISFIGGHPLAGSHKSGVGAANVRLFENAFYVLATTKNTEPGTVRELRNWLAGTNAKFLEMPAHVHDRVVGAISHFPHIVAAGLVHQLSRMEQEHADISALAAGGFRDITRIASSNPTMWHDILLHNKDVLLHLLQDWQVEMDSVRKMLENGDSADIYEFFRSAKMYRDNMPQRKKGAIPAFYDLYVDVPDYPGMIAKVTNILAVTGISITNIQIMEIREDIMGVLRISFRSEDDRDEARYTLKGQNYKTYVI